MKLQYKMPDIDNIDLTITVTMTVDEWRRIMRTLGDVARLSTATYNQPIKE